MKTIALIFLIVPLCFTSKLPFTIKRCKVKDVTCLKQSLQETLPKLQNGIPNLKIPTLDPLMVAEATINGGQHAVQLTQKATDLALSGLSRCRVSKVDVDLTGGKLSLTLINDKLNLTGNYEAHGKILLLPVNGKGKFRILLDNAIGSVNFNIEIYGKNDRKFMKFKSSRLDLKVSHAFYDFENLFDNNRELSDNLNKVLNDNWQEIFDDLVSTYVDAFGEAFMQLLNRFFSKVSLSELFVDQ